MADRDLAFLREFCLSLPETDETAAFGHPNWRVARKTFAVYEEYEGHLCLVFKATLGDQAVLVTDARYFRAPYTGRFGWTSLIIDDGLPKALAKRHIMESYELVAPKRCRVAISEAAPTKKRAKA